MGSNERVAAGAEWLDKVAPGWERRIDLSTLDISDTCHCVCGQVEPLGRQLDAAGERSGYGAVEKWADRHRGLMWVIDHGFTYSPDVTDAWVALIKERFDTGNLSDNPPFNVDEHAPEDKWADR